MLFYLTIAFIFTDVGPLEMVVKRGRIHEQYTRREARRRSDQPLM